MLKIPQLVINAAATAIAVGGGLCLGVLDLETSEVVMTLGVMFVFNMLLGAVVPRGGWYWPFLSAAGILVINWFPQWVRLVSNPYLPRTVLSYGGLALILLTAGTAGMLFGVVVRRTFSTFLVNS